MKNNPHQHVSSNFSIFQAVERLFPRRPARTWARQLIFLPLLVSACSSEPDSEPEVTGSQQEPWATSKWAGVPVGHEVLLKWGIEHANNSLGTSFPWVGEDENCRLIRNPLLHGNCETDASPNDNPATLANYLREPVADWHDNPRLQSLHFLRNYAGNDALEGAWLSCQSARDRMINATVDAVASWHAGNQAWAYFLLGHVTHIIQDGFAEYHVERDEHNPAVIRQVCTYGRSAAGVCRHWAFPDGALEFPGNATDLASRAIYVTASYLRHAHVLFNSNVCVAPDENCRTAVTREMHQFLNVQQSVTDPYDGQFRCDSLTDRPTIVSWDIAGFPTQARDLALCDDGTLYALNADKSLYYNTQKGADTGWSFVTNTVVASSIFCSGNFVHTVNSDGSVWRWVGGLVPWSYVATAEPGSQVVGNNSYLYAMHRDNTVWILPYGGTWTQVGALSASGRLDASETPDPSTGYYVPRLYLYGDGNLWMSTAHGRDNMWENLGGVPGYELSISRGTAYSLDGEGKLWRIATAGGR